jgi:hypothetical protein
VVARAPLAGSERVYLPSEANQKGAEKSVFLPSAITSTRGTHWQGASARTAVAAATETVTEPFSRMKSAS